MSFLGYPKVIRYTKFEQFGIIRFRVLRSGQTNKQTDLNILLTPTESVGVGN